MFCLIFTVKMLTYQSSLVKHYRIENTKRSGNASKDSIIMRFIERGTIACKWYNNVL